MVEGRVEVGGLGGWDARCRELQQRRMGHTRGLNVRRKKRQRRRRARGSLLAKKRTDTGLGRSGGERYSGGL